MSFGKFTTALPSIHSRREIHDRKVNSCPKDNSFPKGNSFKMTRGVREDAPYNTMNCRPAA